MGRRKRASYDRDGRRDPVADEKMDKYCPGSRRIIDYKTYYNLHELYYNVRTRERQTFVEEFGYMMRAAVYGEIERQNRQETSFPSF